MPHVITDDAVGVHEYTPVPSANRISDSGTRNPSTNISMRYPTGTSTSTGVWTGTWLPGSGVISSMVLGRPSGMTSGAPRNHPTRITPRNASARAMKMVRYLASDICGLYAGGGVLLPLADTSINAISRGTSLIVVRVNPVLEQLGSYAIAEFQARAREMRAAGRRVVDFSIGDPREPTPSFIPEAMIAAVPEVSQYPTVSGLPVLREAIADYASRRFGVSVDPDTEIIPTTGSKEAVFSTPMAFVDRQAGEGVIWPTPGYPIYERGALLAGATPLPVSLSGDFIFRPSDVPDEAWEVARMAWICTPHNPAGATTPLDVLSDFHARAAAEDVLLCSDECYVDLYDGEKPHSILEVGGTQGVLSFLSLSKRSGMTGYRSGAIIGDPRAIKALKALRTGTGTAPPEFVQAAAVAAWSDDDHATERRAIFKEKRRIISKAFADLGYPTVASEAGLYVWVKVPDDVAITKQLLDDGIVVSPGRAFGTGGEGHLRLALVPTIDECHEAVKVVQECLSAS